MAGVIAKVRIDTKVMDELPLKLTAAKSTAAYAGAMIGASLAKEGIRRGRAEWQPLAKSTIERKGHDKILWDSRKLYHSIKAHKGLRIGTASWGTDVKYGENHELGIGVPKRAFLKPTATGGELALIITATRKALEKFFK